MDQYMGYYTPLVLVIAALVWFFTKELDRVITILIGACPCAFILATPTAMVAALSAAARLGILVKNVADIELAARINAFVFDKTGTLTTGKLAVSRLAPLGEVKPADLLRRRLAEQYSNHPTAKALAQLACEAGVPLAEPHDFKETAGAASRRRSMDEPIMVGRAHWLQDNGVTEDFMQSVDLNETEGCSLMFVARNGRCIGWIGVAGPNPRRGQNRAAGAERERRAAHRHGLGRPPAGRYARGRAKSAARRSSPSVCRRTRWSLCVR